MKNMYIDLETYSDTDIFKAGHFRYIDSDAFEVLLFAYSYGDEVNVVSLLEGEYIPDDVVRDLFSPLVLKHAFNASFEWYALSKYFDLSEAQRNQWLYQWECSQLHGLYLALPPSLKGVCEALRLPQEQAKDRQGASLIKLFCVPQEPSRTNGGRARTFPFHEPEKWALFKEYNRQDVTAEMAVENMLAPFPVPQQVIDDWRLNEIIVSRGIFLDREFVTAADKMADDEKKLISAQLQRLTGLDKITDKPLCEWISAQLREKVTSLKKETAAELTSREDLPENVKRAIEMRSAINRTSVAKYKTMEETICADGTVKGALQYYKSRTGRWAGQFIQPQNIPQVHIDDIDMARKMVKEGDKAGLRENYGDDVIDTLSQLIRTAIIAPEGKVFVDADFSAIEARVISWLADEQWRLEVFRTHGKIYEASASRMFHVPIEKIVKGNPEYALRAKGKIAELALGYQGGVPALMNFGADKMGLTMTDMKNIISDWRNANKNICGLWTSFQTAAVSVTRTASPVGVHKVVFEREQKGGLDFLSITLPSGRKLYYGNPRVSAGQFGDQLTFTGTGVGGAPAVLTTYGGRITENIVQAIARDILAEKIRQLEQAGIRIIFHVHDEVVTEWDKGSESLETVCSIMKAPVSWAADLPLNAEGYISSYFKKE